LVAERREQSPARRSLSRRAAGWTRRTSEALHLRIRLLQFLARLLPVNMFGGTRAALLRLSGARIGPRTAVYGAITLHGFRFNGKRLTLGSRVWISPQCSIDLSADVRVGDDVSFGHDVVIITSDHTIGPAERRCGVQYAQPVEIGRGAWIGARATIVPGVRIGPGSIVAAGSTVYRDVAPNTMVAGSPARVIRQLGPDAQAGGDSPDHRTTPQPLPER
jgi:maltose O-acetyltransferase